MLKVGLAYSAFFGAFKYFYPELEVIQSSLDVNKYDLIIFSGGEDINPRIYGEQNRHSYFNDKRDEIELSILARCDVAKKKILGICRGHQLINAYLGGGLIQDLYFDGDGNHPGHHELNYMPGISLTRYIFNNSSVNSIHHQGVVRVGNSLKASSTFRGVIESTESPYIYSVQFHPEFMGEDGKRFFEVVNKWVVDRDGLTAEIKSSTSSSKTSYEDGDFKTMFRAFASKTRNNNPGTVTLNWEDGTNNG